MEQANQTERPKKRILILGAGGIGSTVAQIMEARGYEVNIVDEKAEAAQKLPASLQSRFGVLDVMRSEETLRLSGMIQNADMVIAAVPYDAIEKVGEMCSEFGTHFIAPTESTHIDNAVRALAAKSAQSGSNALFAPQCGVSPGHSSVITQLMTEDLTTIDSIKIRVGALQQEPDGSMCHGATWSPESMLMEYLERVEAMNGGQFTHLNPILPDRQEALTIDYRGRFNGRDEQKQFTFEARDTAGGLASTVATLATENPTRTHPGTEVNYKSLRFPGHWQAVEALLQETMREFNYCKEGETMALPAIAAILCNRSNAEVVPPVEEAPAGSEELQRRHEARQWAEEKFVARMREGNTRDDMVVVYVDVEGSDATGKVHRTFTDITTPKEIPGIPGKTFTAIEATTAAGITAAAEQMLSGKLKPGYVGQTDLDPMAYYKDPISEAVFGDIDYIKSRITETRLPGIAQTIPQKAAGGWAQGAG